MLAGRTMTCGARWRITCSMRSPSAFTRSRVPIVQVVRDGRDATYRSVIAIASEEELRLGSAALIVEGVAGVEQPTLVEAERLHPDRVVAPKHARQGQEVLAVPGAA